MKRSPLPRRPGVTVTELGFGGASVGNLYTSVSDDGAVAAIDTAWECGVRYFDTAPHYGLGLSEERLGEALATRPRTETVLSTKVGRLLVPSGLGPPRGDDGFVVDTDLTRVVDFSADAVVRSLDQSLTRLGVGSIDIVLVHDPDDHWHQASRHAVPTLCRLRDEGVIGAVGVGMNESEMPARFVAETDIDVVMCAGRYTLLDQSALDDLLPLAQERGVAVLAAGVFNSGLLANSDPIPDARYDYRPAPAALVRRAREIAAVCEVHDSTLPAAAIHFAAAHPAVASVVVGISSAAQAARNAELLENPPPAALWDELVARRLIRADAPIPT